MPTFPTPRREFLAAASDCLRLRAGLPTPAPHPHGERLADERARLGDIATHCCELAAVDGDRRAQSALSRQGSAIGFGVSTPDFKSLLGNLARAQVERAYVVHTPFIKKICRQIELPDFRPVEVGAAAGIDIDFSPVSELQPASTVRLKFVAGETVRVESYATRINVSREIVVNDDVGALTDAINQTVAALARKEGANILEPLTQVNNLAGGTLNLVDGLPMFHPDHNNLVEGTGTLTRETFQAALTALASQRVPGSTTAGELRPRFALINPSAELNLRSLLVDTGLSELIEVITSNSVPVTQFGVFSDPLYGAAFASARLAGTTQPVLGALGAARKGADDIATVIISADFGAAPIGRFGAVLCLS